MSENLQPVPVSDDSTTPTQEYSLDLPEPAPVVVVKESGLKIEDYSKPWPNDKAPDVEVSFMPSGSMKETQKVINDTPNSALKGNRKTEEWKSTLSSGLAALVYDHGLDSTVNREGADFTQSVESDTGKLSGIYPAFRTKEGTRYTGEAARFRIRSALNLGTVFTFPLWHSGFWMTLKAPSEGDLLELYRRIDADKVTLGRATYGLLFSNSASYTAKILLDFVIDHVYETSLKLAEGEDLRNYIRTPDLPLLIWGIACSIWPAGFPYQRSCISDPEKCHHILKEKLNLSKLLWTDTTALTKRQISHMTKRQRGTVDSVEVKRYVSEFIRGQSHKIELTPALSVIMKVPTVPEHINAGFRWINAIEENYGNGMMLEADKRDAYLVKHGKATIMRQYTHFIESIEVGGDLYDDPEDIEETLTDLTANDTIRNAFFEKVAKYIDDSVISLIAIPTYKCPSCGSEKQISKSLGRFPGLIPLDVSQTFFTLLVQRLSRIELR